jgi:hypothetical protein
MKVKSRWPLVLLLLLFSTPGFATSINNIAITGTALQGLDISFGDFQFEGNGLFLVQGFPVGLSSIGSCTLGAICDLSFNIGSTAMYCSYCKDLAFGSFNGAVVEFLDANIAFDASGLYSGQSNITVPLTFKGTIVGYKLVSCQGNVGCSLGPKEFSLRINGHGTGDFVMSEMGIIRGVSANLTGRASVVPEPTSLLLVGSGLAGITLAKQKRRKKQSVSS